MTEIKLVSSDLNGTLVENHTMSHMMEPFLSDEEFDRLIKMFEKQTSGEATIKEAFECAEECTKGLSLRSAIKYTIQKMTYVEGFGEFLEALHKKGIPLVINSTGYSVTIYAIKEQYPGRIHGHIGNYLVFGEGGKADKELSESDLEKMVKAYFQDPARAESEPLYDLYQATGKINLGIEDEEAKVQKLMKYKEDFFGHLKSEEVAHMGDTMGDKMGILDIARAGGLGIAFNYIKKLKSFLDDAISDSAPKGKIIYVDEKTDPVSANLKNLLAAMGLE